MLLLTVAIILALSVLSYILFDKDWLAPPTIVCLTFLFGSLCTIYNEEKWGLQFSGETTWTIFIGLFSFMVGGIIAIVVISLLRRGKPAFFHIQADVKPIDVGYYKTIFVILFQIVVIFLVFMQIRRIAGGSSWFNMISVYRSLTGFNQDLDDQTLVFPWIIRQLLEVNSAFGYIYSYIAGNNIAVKAKKNLLNFIPIILCCVVTFMQGYRSGMLRYWVALLIVTYTIKKRSTGWRSNRETKKMIRRIVLSVLVIAVLFVALRSTVGRLETDWDPLFYLTHYAGSPIAALDLYLKNPLPKSDIWGKECFFELNRLIATRTNNNHFRYIFYKEFRYSPSGMLIGNIYTALRPPYQDFGGAVGMALFMLIMGLFFTSCYIKVRDKKNESVIDFRLLLYSYIGYTFFLYFYNMYNTWISPGFIKYIVELYVIVQVWTRFFVKDKRKI